MDWLIVGARVVCPSVESTLFIVLSHLQLVSQSVINQSTIMKAIYAKSVQQHHITYFFLRSQFYKLLLFWRKKCLYTVQSSSFCPSAISVSVQSEVTSIQGLSLRIDS